MACTWFGEICCWCSQTSLPEPSLGSAYHILQTIFSGPVQGFKHALFPQTHAISLNTIELLGHITFSIIAAFCHPAAAEEWTLLPARLPLPPCLADRKTALYSWLTLNEHLAK